MWKKWDEWKEEQEEQEVRSIEWEVEREEEAIAKLTTTSTKCITTETYKKKLFKKRK